MDIRFTNAPAVPGGGGEALSQVIFRNDEHSPWLQESFPGRYAGFETHVVDRPLGPDHVEVTVGKRQVIHGAVQGGDPVGQPGFVRPELQLVEELREDVDCRDPGIQLPG